MPSLQGAYIGDAGGIHPGAEMGDRIRIRETRVRVAQRGNKKFDEGAGAGGASGGNGGRHLMRWRRGRIERGAVARRH